MQEGTLCVVKVLISLTSNTFGLHAVFSDARLSREWRVLRRWAASRYKGQERSYEYTVYQKTLGFQHPYVVEEDMRGQTSSSWEFSAT